MNEINLEKPKETDRDTGTGCFNTSGKVDCRLCRFAVDLVVRGRIEGKGFFTVMEFAPLGRHQTIMGLLEQLKHLKHIAPSLWLHFLVLNGNNRCPCVCEL